MSVQCNEARPRCSTCTRYSEPCTYPPSSNEASPSQASGSSLTLGIPIVSGRATAPASDLSNASSELNLGDLELLHNWTLEAYTAFGDSTDTEDLWRRDIPREALRHPFLMRSLLAVSALHISRTRPAEKERYLAIAAYHQNRALPAYRSMVEDLPSRMTRDNASAILAFGQLIVAYAFASPHPPGNVLFAGLCSSTGVPEWLTVLRGARRVHAIAGNWQLDSLIFSSSQSLAPPVDPSLSPDDVHLVELGQKMDNLSVSSEQGEDMAAYREALSCLRRSFAIPRRAAGAEQRDVKSAVLNWVEEVPQRYLELLSAVHPLGLVILCYFCVLLDRSSRWYVSGAPQRIVREIYGILDEEWRAWLGWPMARVLRQ